MIFVRLDVQTLSDPKLRLLNDRQFRAWIGSLCLAKQNRPQGILRWSSGAAITITELLQSCGISATDAQAEEDVAVFLHLGLWRQGRDTVLSIANWDRYQSPPSWDVEYRRKQKRNERRRKGVVRMSLRQPHDIIPRDSETLRPRDLETTEKTRMPPEAAEEGEAEKGNGHDSTGPRGVTSLQHVIEHYKRIKHLGAPGGADPAQDRVLFPRFAQSAAGLLVLAKQDVTLACRAITEIGHAMDAWHKSWRLSTVVNEWPEWFRDRGHPA